MNLLSRGNDLQEQFWPIFYFVKQQILENGTLPLWNNLFFSGTPLLPDPQSPLFYPPNTIFLLLPLGIGFIVSFLLHIILGGVGAYFAAKNGFGFSKSASLFSAALYIVSPQIAGRLEAGHFGLVNSFAWLPFALLATVKLARSPSFRWSVLLAVSLAGLFFTHTLIFLIAAFLIPFLWAGVQLRGQAQGLINNFKYLGIGGLLAFGLTAVTLLPQLEWKDQTTRFLLLETRDVYPKWTSAAEFLRAVLWPWNAIETLDTEKWLALGIVPSFLALLGFFHLGRRAKILLFALTGILLLVVLNNASPLYSTLLSQDWYVLMRVATRVWFIPVLLVAFLAGYGLEVLEKKEMGRRLIMAVALFSILELLALSWLRLNMLPPEREFAPEEVYDFLQKDEARFRVFCTTRCFSQQEAAKAGLELVEGYNTFQQLNYFKHSWQLMGGFWNYYTLAVPPIGAYKFEKLQPSAASLGEYNTKYVISPYELEDKNFVLKKQVNGYFVYLNEAFLPRAYYLKENRQPGSEAPILKYSPNHIRVDTSSAESPHLVLAEVWSPGWKAYLNGKDEVAVQQTPEALRFVDLKESTKFVDFKYKPKSYNAGRIITLATVLLLLTATIYQKRSGGQTKRT